MLVSVRTSVRMSARVSMHTYGDGWYGDILVIMTTML